MIVTYNIPEEIDQRIRDLAEEEGRSLSAMATRLLEKALGAKSKKSLARPKASDIDVQMANYILEGVLRIKPNLGKKNMNTWAEHCRKMRELDGRDPRQIAEVFRWANNDSFWQTNILGPDKLRKQFDQLELKANQVKSHENTGRNAARTALQQASDQARASAIHAASLIAGNDIVGADDSTVRQQVGQDRGQYLQGGQEWEHD